MDHGHISNTLWQCSAVRGAEHEWNVPLPQEVRDGKGGFTLEVHVEDRGLKWQRPCERKGLLQGGSNSHDIKAGFSQNILNEHR